MLEFVIIFKEWEFLKVKEYLKMRMDFVGFEEF